jgi:hypothetical protein
MARSSLRSRKVEIAACTRSQRMRPLPALVMGALALQLARAHLAWHQPGSSRPGVRPGTLGVVVQRGHERCCRHRADAGYGAQASDGLVPPTELLDDLVEKSDLVVALLDDSQERRDLRHELTGQTHALHTTHEFPRCCPSRPAARAAARGRVPCAM